MNKRGSDQADNAAYISKLTGATIHASLVNGRCEPPCNIANPRDASIFPAGTPLSRVLDISTSRTGHGGPISIF